MDTRGKMKKKRLFIIGGIISIIVIFLILLVPRVAHGDDGGSVLYEAVLYSIRYRHSMFYNEERFDWYRPEIEEGVRGYLIGYKIIVFGIVIRDDIKFVTADECECKRCNKRIGGSSHAVL